MLRALEQLRRMRGGAQSHLMRCSAGNYHVVKFQNNSQHRRILVNELLGTKLAARLGLATPPVAIEASMPYSALMIERGFCFNAGDWNFRDAPLRGLYPRNCVYWI